jgi:hypothetical protein
MNPVWTKIGNNLTNPCKCDSGVSPKCMPEKLDLAFYVSISPYKNLNPSVANA